jgi:hypothetical protein
MYLRASRELASTRLGLRSTYTLSVRTVVGQQQSTLSIRNVVCRRGVKIEEEFSTAIETDPGVHCILESHLFDRVHGDELN